MQQRRSKEGWKYFLDEETEREYRRIYGGIAWPGIFPGFAVVVGEQFVEDMHKDDIAGYYLIAEAEALDVRDLVAQAYALGERLKVEKFYGEANHGPFMDIVRVFNNGLKFGGLFIDNAPFIGDTKVFQFYTNMLKGFIGKGALKIEEGRQLVAYMQQLTPERQPTASAFDFPAIAALGYAVAALDHYKSRETNRVRPDRAEDTGRVDIFNTDSRRSPWGGAEMGGLKGGS